MLLSRDFVAHMAAQLIKRLVESEMIEVSAQEPVIQRVRRSIQEEISVEERLNEEVRNKLTEFQDDIRRSGASYQEMYKKAKAQLARERKLILR